MNKIKLYRKLLELGKDLGSPFAIEHEWLYNLINSYEGIDKCYVYSLFTEKTDYYTVRQQFMITILKGIERYYDIKKFKDVHSSIEDIIELWRKDTKQQKTGLWSAAWSAARSAAWSAARSAARSAAWSAAWSAARSAARSAAESARSAARSAAEKEQINIITSLIRKYS